jgi:hypothetical protein
MVLASLNLGFSTAFELPAHRLSAAFPVTTERNRFEQEQQDDGPDRGVGDERSQSVTEVDMHRRQQPMAEESADQAYCQIAGKPHTAESKDVACHPADKQAYQ